MNTQVILKIQDEKECDACEGTGSNFYSCCGDDMRGRDLDNCPTCHEHTGWDGKSDGDCIECDGTGILNTATQEV